MLQRKQSTSRLLIIEDSGFIADALAQLVQLLPHIHIVGHASTSEEALRMVQDYAPSMISLDLRIRSDAHHSANADHGLATLRLLREQYPALPVLVVTALPEQPWLRITAQLGAVGFVSKERSSEEILAAIQSVSAGMLAFTVAQLSFIRHHIVELSPREYAVLRLLAEGLSNHDIAGQLSISVGTVRKHVEHIFSNLQAHTRTQAIAMARQEGLID